MPVVVDGVVVGLTRIGFSPRGVRDGYAGCFLVDDGVVGGERRGERLQGQVVDRAGVTTGGVVDQSDRVI